MGRKLVAALAAWAAVVSPALAQETPAPLRVALVVDGPGAVPEETARTIETELAELSVDRPPEFVSRVTGSWTAASAASLLETALTRPDVDIVIGVGPLVARAAAGRASLPRPVFLTLIGEPALHGLPPADAGDDRPIAYRSDALDLERDLAGLGPILGRPRVAVAIDAAVAPSLTGLDALLDRAGREAGVTFVAWPVQPRDTLGGLPPDVQAVHTGLLLSLDAPARRAWIEALRARRLAVIEGLDPRGVEDGALATRLPDGAPRLRARRVSLDVVAHLEGAPAASLRGPSTAVGRLVLNAETLRALDLSVPGSLRTEASIVGEEEVQEGPEVTLASAIELALDRSHRLEAARQDVRAGDARVRIERAELLPHIDGTVDWTFIDEDRAEGPFPPAEHTFSAGLVGRQTLYSPRVRARFAGERSQQDAREEDFAAARLGLIAETSAAYFRVLRSRTAERVQRENLENVRANLNVARERERVGSGGPEEVYRLRIEAASRLRDTIRAAAASRQAEIALNRLTARPPEAPFRTRETALEELPILGADPRLARYLDDPSAFRALRAFAVAEALEAAPELRAIRARREATRHERRGRFTGFFVPDVALEAGLRHRFHEAGAGSQAVDIPGFPTPDALDWSVGVVASFPLLSGLGRIADTQRIDAELAGNDAETRELRLGVAAEVRAALHGASAAFAAIALSEEAAEAARENLTLVADAYARGRLDVIRLVDAQTQHLVTELDAVNARYDFAIEMVAVERAMGRFSFGPDARLPAAFFDRLRVFERTAARRTGDER